jgi:autotransporter-associated beta strand protein
MILSGESCILRSNDPIDFLSKLGDSKAMKKFSSLKARPHASFFKATFSLSSTHRNLWLGLAILAVGAFGNSVQAATWLDENFNSYLTTDVLNTTKSPMLSTFSTANTVIVDSSGNKKLNLLKAIATSNTGTLYKLSDTGTTDRSQGYVSFKISQGTTGTAGNYMAFSLGAADANSMSASLSHWMDVRFVIGSPSTITIYSGNGATSGNPIQQKSTVNPLYSSSYSFPASECTVQIWYNRTLNTFTYFNPSGVSKILNSMAYVVYVNGTACGVDGGVGSGIFPASVCSPTSPTLTSGVATIGKLGFIGGVSGSAHDFTIDDIYAADTAPTGATPIATTYTWNNTGSNWSSASSWTNGTAPATNAIIDTAAFGSAGSGATSVNVGTGNQIGGIVFNVGAYAYTWTGTDIKVLSTGGIVNSSAANQTFGNMIINSSGNATWSSVAGGSMLFNGGIDLSESSTNRTLTFAGAGNVTVGSAIANGGGSTGGGVTFTSTGTNLLSGNNTYGGATTIAANSTLKIGSTTALGSTSGSTVVSLGGVLDLNGQTVSDEPLTLEGTGISSAGALVNTSVTNTSWSGPVTLVSAATYMNASSGKITVSGVVSGGSKGIYKIGRGTLELSGANTYTGTTTLTDGTMILSGSNSGAAYTLSASADSLNPVLKLSATNVMSSSATVSGSSSTIRSGTIDFATAGNYTLNQYTGQNLNFSNSSGSAAFLTFTNLNNALSTSGGKTLFNQSTNLTITFNGQLDISGGTADSSSISAIGPVVISNRVWCTNTGTNFPRSFIKKETGTLTIYGVNSYNGTTTVSGGTLVIPNGGSLTNCSNTIVKGSGTTSATSASLNLGGAAGVVQVSTNGFVRGDTNGSTTTLGTISSLQVQNLGTVEVALATTWSTGGTIDFASGSKVSATGTAPVTGSGPYTLMTATGADITGIAPTLSPNIVGWNLKLSGLNLILEETPVGQFEVLEGLTKYFLDITGGITLTKQGAGTGIISGANNFSGGTVLEAGILEVGNSNGLGTGAVTLTSGTLRSTVNLDLGKLVESTTALSAGFQAVYGGASSRVQYTTATTVKPTTINGPVTLDVGDGYTMTMGTLIGNSSPSSLVTKIGAGTVKLMGGSTKLGDMAPNGNASSVLGGWRIQEGTVWFNLSSNNGAGNGPITLSGGTAKFSKLQNSNATYTGFDVPSDLTVASNGLIQFDPDPVTLLGQNNLGFGNLSIGSNTLTVATATTSSPSMVGQGLPSVNFASVTLTGGATLNNPVNLDLNLQAVSGTAGFTKTGLGTLYLSDQPNQAAAFAVLASGGVGSIIVEYAGSGYAVDPAAAPAVTFVAVNGGSGAAATAVIDGSGRVSFIKVTSAGSGYLSLPRIVIAAPPTVATANSYTGATIVNEGKLNLSGSYASSVTVGSGAALQLDWLAPAQAKCSIDSISPTSTSITATIAGYSYVKDLYLTKSVGGYVPSTPFEFDLPAPARVDGTGTATGTATYVLAAAKAKATVDSTGFISALEILNGGSGYAITPMVTIPAPTQPTVVAKTTGSITFETGAKLSVKNAPIGTGASCKLLTADQGIFGVELLQLDNLPGYALSTTNEGGQKTSLILTDNRTGPTFSSNPTAAAITYGQSLAPSNLNPGSASVPGAFAWKNAGTLLPAGTSSQIVTFTPTDPILYRPAEFTVSVTVDKVDPATVFPTAAMITYGQALSAATLTGGTGEGTYAFTSLGTIPDAGLTQNFEVTFTPTDAVNYNTLRQNVAVTVNKANPATVFPTAATITYGQALSAATLTGGTGTGTYAFTSLGTIPDAGLTQNFEVTFTPTDAVNYNTLRQNVAVTVNKANPTVTWPTAGAITYGDSLSAAVFSGASTNGNFAFTNPTTVPDAGIARNFEVTFTPTDAVNYNTLRQNVAVTVNKANPATVFPTAATITYGQALSAATLTGGTGTGTYAFTSLGTIPDAGLTQDFEVTFTPTDAVNYNTLRQNVAVTVNKANPTVSWPAATPITAGQALSYSTLSNGSATGVGGASVEGAFAWTDSTTARSTTGNYDVTFTPTSGNYNTATLAVSVTVNPAGTTYSDWLSSNGATASDAAFLDYVFGAVTPGSLDSSLKPTVAVTAGNLVLTYYVRQGTRGLTVRAQTSDDLATSPSGWVNVTPEDVGVPRNVNGVSVQQKTASVSASGASKFLRIQAEQL